jgi:hypothetical protein
VLNWVKVRNPWLAARAALELRAPGSLLRQARRAVWRAVGRAGAAGEGPGQYRARVLLLGRGESLLPGVLMEYLQCAP